MINNKLNYELRIKSKLFYEINEKLLLNILK